MHPEQVRRIGMIRLDGENLPVDLLGRLPAGPPDGAEQGNRQCFWESLPF